MKLSFRRLLALAAVFAIAFVAVTAIRTWNSGGSLRTLLPWLSKKSGDFHPLQVTWPEKAPLDLGDVELLSRLNNEYAKLTEAVVPSVVSIDTVGIGREQGIDIFGQIRIRDYPTQGQGSGVIVAKEGYIVTNHHVIAGSQKIKITLHGEKTYDATLVGEDTLLDIAVLKIDSNETFVPLKLGDSSQAQVGQIVFAVGNPFGLGETVTQGIISAKERSLSDTQRDLFQTDAAINPGNSGGPLVNLRGEIIGINAAIFSRDKEKPAFQGVGFSIPSNDVKDALFQILERGKPIRGFLGVKLNDLDQRSRAILGYQEENGVLILNVFQGSPAQSAGLQAGDIVRVVNDEKIHSTTQLLSLLQRTKVGTVINLDVWRKGKSLKISATIAEAGVANPAIAVPANPTAQSRTMTPDEAWKALGITVRDLEPAERAGGFQGVLVTSLTDDGIAKSRFLPGDLIVTMNNSPVISANKFRIDLSAFAAAQDTTLNVVREGQLFRALIPALPRQQ
ncbi:MAG: trypsin-like peptidase domain-containing protein [Luteolibacter sp.]|uniref:trypsin-like peptidase domain-containing protein n=1 Tax=Luteolibacter sp. TaxID=1962973 RepID=UPI00326625DF